MADRQTPSSVKFKRRPNVDSGPGADTGAVLGDGVVNTINALLDIFKPQYEGVDIELPPEKYGDLDPRLRESRGLPPLPEKKPVRKRPTR